MGKEKKELSPEEQLAALQAENATLKQVVEGQNQELENLGAEKKHEAPVIKHKSKKYKVLAQSCSIPDGSRVKTVAVVSEGRKVASDEDLDAILKIEGQGILELLTSKK